MAPGHAAVDAGADASPGPEPCGSRNSFDSPTITIIGAATGPSGPSNGPGSTRTPGVSGRVMTFAIGFCRFPPSAVIVSGFPPGPPNGAIPVAYGVAVTRSRYVADSP